MNDRAKCDDCQKIWSADELREPKHLHERLDPGGTVPSGECPACGALAYPYPRPDNRAIMESFLTGSVLPILPPTGVWVAPNPAPLTAEEVEPIFERVAQHRLYTRQQLSTATEDDMVVHLQNGVVHSEPAKGTPWEDSPKIFPREESP